MIIGLDVGGTHADIVLIGKTGVIRSAKVPTRVDDLFQTVLTGFEKATEGIAPGEITRIVLSTTLATNAIVQDKIPPVGMIVSAGPGIDPEFFRTHRHYHSVSGAVDHRGRELQPIDPDEIHRVAASFVDAGIRHVGVVGKFSVRNPVHELETAVLLKDRFEKVFLGHRLSGSLNFPRRIGTTYLNAAVYPIHREFFLAVEKSLMEKGFAAPIRILKADGGNMNFRASLACPAQTILSGPAASVIGTLACAPETEEILALDIGGTTTDMAILINRAPLMDPLGVDLGGFKTLIRSLETRSVGIGGDSRVRVGNGAILIGPERTGPAMAFGGTDPTPTDALIVLDKMREGDRHLAEKGIETVARQMDMSIVATAQEIFLQACRRILVEVRELIDQVNSQPVYTLHEMLEGFTVNPTRIFISGGPAPHIAKGLENEGDFELMVVPRWSVANAIGAALARTTSEVALFADTQQGIATAPEENFSRQVSASYSQTDAEETAYTILREKAVARGAHPDHLQMETTEAMTFNMIRGFNTVGRNIRVKVQIKPGLIRGYESVIGL